MKNRAPYNRIKQIKKEITTNIWKIKKNITSQGRREVVNIHLKDRTDTASLISTDTVGEFNSLH